MPSSDIMGHMEVIGFDGPITTISDSSTDSISPGDGDTLLYLMSTTSGLP